MKTSRSVGLFSLALSSVFLAPTALFAHPGHGPAVGFTAGALHPFGLDHMLAMVAVGLWAWQIGGRAIWAVPLSFVSMMVVGGAAGMAHLPFGFVEQGILTSVLVLGLAITLAVRPALWMSAALVAVFALFHGYAHGAEMPANASSLGYAAGFALITASLHAAGIGLGLAMGKLPKAAVRIAGSAVALAGLFLAFQ